LNSSWHQAATLRREKRESKMSSIKRTLIALTAALTLSTLAVGAAVGPAQAAGAPVQAHTHA